MEKRIDRFVPARLRPAVHRASVSLRACAGIPEAVAEGYRLSLPPCSVTGVRATRVDPLIEVDHPAVMVEAVKLAEDRSGDLIVRLYEAHGSRVRVIRHFAATDATETDLLERPLTAPRAPFAADGSALTIELRPFQLVTLRFARR
ncbi:MULTISPECIES: glycosyl hydrolase-related protein [unclassified Cryobacterium]|uniref:glycosyl hydrolase-related protein n=1 Tax=unclassified Cryobacterium TaxID=2649013 RepID=UPI0018E07860|nr:MULTISPECIES: glycosyl hydrolase-related protein [unclassified Cryobacterium]